MDIINSEFSIVFDLSKTYLHATYHSESGEAATFKKVLTVLAQTCNTHHYKKVMLVSNNAKKLNQVEIFSVITECVPLYFNIKFAFFDLFPTQIETHQFGEMIAQNRGINAKYFTEFEAAEQWLIKD